MAALDARTIERGSSGRYLMERAGAAIGQQIVMLYPTSRRVTVVCGPGNNGGDGLVIARFLRSRHYSVTAVLVSSEKYSAECLTQISQTSDVSLFGAVPKVLSDVPCVTITQDELLESLKSSSLVVDALLGTGQRAQPHGVIADVVGLVARGKLLSPSCQVISVDIPTGIHADTGVLYEPHIEADRTLSVEYIKRGMLQFPGRTACGSIDVVSIGITHEGAVENTLVTDYTVPRLVPRAPDTHKGLLGKILVVGGSLAMPGAPMLSALAALRAGAGIVSRVVRKGWSTIPPLPEAMFVVLEGQGDYLHDEDAAAVSDAMKRFDTVVLGPGIGTAPRTAGFLRAILEAARGTALRVVVDADALNVIASSGFSFAGISAVITPHPGEASRLLGISAREVQDDRYGSARALAERFGVVVVLKGAGTVIHNGSNGRLVADGTPYLATPGSGDVLAGIIAACAARSASLFDAATVGVWVHAKAGRKAAERSGGAFLASAITDEVGSCLTLLE